MALEAIPVADIRVPDELSRLRDMAYNLWWSWTPRARRLFSDIDTTLWSTYRNPVQLLINIEPHQWERLINDGGAFMSDYRRLVREFDRYMQPETTPFAENFPGYDGPPVAYFSTEFGLHECLGIYSGGLGVLSGDHAKAASDYGLPFIGIGILYRKGYFHQSVDADGDQDHIFKDFDFHRLPVSPVQSSSGHPLVVSVDLPGRDVLAKVWQLKVGRVHLYLLDTDIPENDIADRPITSQLYVRGREMRLCQELVLGIGGARILRELGISPAVWHMNEGHSAFLAIERLRSLVRDGHSFEDASAAIAADTVFTTHTPVPAGNEAFDTHLVEKYLSLYAKTIGVDTHRLIELGISYPEGGGQPFNLTALAIRMSHNINGVSKLHGEVSSHMWHHLFPGKSAADLPVDYVTNGVHVATWLGHDMRTLVEEEIGADWNENLTNQSFWEGIRNIRDEDVWAAHQNQKERMVRLVRSRLVAQFGRHGKSPDEMREVNHLLDPRVLTIGFARRFATYKRAGLIFKDYNRLKAILTHADRPVQIIFSGKAHPADMPGQDLVRHIFNIAFHSDIAGKIIFLEDYDMRICRHLVQGVDVWLNTPRRPREASGTSGMKAAMNGAPNLSISDGWWPEAFNGHNGWLISDGREFDNEEMQDYEDSSSFYEIMEQQVVPAYYDHREKGVPVKWVEIMKDSMATIIPAFSAARMLGDYAEKFYMPIVQSR
jgi:glycogen phosphorylase